MYIKYFVSKVGTFIVTYDRVDGEIVNDKYYIRGEVEVTIAIHNLIENNFIKDSFDEELLSYSYGQDQRDSNQDAFEAARVIAEDHMRLHNE